MDNNQNNSNSGNKPISSYSSNSSVPNQPTGGPKSFDLSSINSLNSDKPSKMFQKKPFVIGVLSVIVLAFVGGLAVLLFNSQGGRTPTSPTPRAGSGFDDVSGPIKYRYVQQTNGPGSEATLQVEFANNGSDGKTYNIEVKSQKFWCSTVAPGSNGAATICNEHGTPVVPQWQLLSSLKPGETVKTEILSQKIGNNGTCGSAQVDFFIRLNGGSQFGPYWSVALNQPCATHKVCQQNACKVVDGAGKDECATDSQCQGLLKCTNITLDPTTVAPGQRFRLEAFASGGIGNLSYTWKVSTNGAGSGTFSSTNNKIVLWTAPSTLPGNQTWTFTATVKDTTGKTDSSGCTQTLSYSVTPPPPPTFNHKVCNSNNACVTVPCSPTTVDCSSSTDCKSNADCQTTTYKFNTCENNACVRKVCPDPKTPCEKDTDCKSDNDCKTTTVTHKECQNNACVTVSGAGSDTCTSDASCQPAATPPPVPESGNTALTLGALLIGLITVLGGVFLAL